MHGNSDKHESAGLENAVPVTQGLRGILEMFEDVACHYDIERFITKWQRRLFEVQIVDHSYVTVLPAGCSTIRVAINARPLDRGSDGGEYTLCVAPAATYVKGLCPGTKLAQVITEIRDHLRISSLPELVLAMGRQQAKRKHVGLTF